MPLPSWRVPVALFALLGTLLAGCSRNDGFNVQNARAHVERLTSAGSRWTGTPANEKARGYVIEALQLQGFEVRVQEADASWRQAGVTTRVANIIAIKPGQRREAIALVSHYDSVAWGPGAGDAALGTAVALEGARVLGARPSPQYSLMVLITDGEEHGLQGARVLLDDPEVRARLKVFINLEAVGAARPFPLFETGPGTSPALRAWARMSRPRGGSYMQSIYDALPNDTDFSILKDLPGVSGVNFAAVGDGWAYHTDRDRADRVPDRLLGDAGAMVLEVVTRLDAEPSLAPSPEAPMYFSLLDRVAFVWPLRRGVVTGWGVLVIGLLAWFALARHIARTGGPRNVVMTIVWALIASGAVLGALVAAVWLVRGGRAELHPWFASPWRLFSFMTAMVVAVTWIVRRLAAAAPPALRPDGSPFGVWFAALPAWIGLLGATLIYAPAAAYLVWVPLGAAVVLVVPTIALVGAGPVPRTWTARVGSAAVAILTWALWGPDLLVLLSFVVTLLGRLPVVTPTWAYPAVFFLAGVLLWPPVLAVLVGRMRWRVAHGVAAGAIMLAVVVTGLFAYMAPAYTAERPLQRSAMFVEDRVRNSAHWELASNEPGLDIGSGGPANVAWQPAATRAVVMGELVPKAHLFRGVVPLPASSSPATISAVMIRRSGDVDIEVAVTPASREWGALAVVLPADIVPTRSTLVGRSRAARWQAWHTNVPADGLTWRATVPASQADRLTGTEVWVSRFALPGAAVGSRVPSWLETPHTAWMTEHVVMLPIVLNETQEAPAALTPLSLPIPSANPSVAAPLQPAAAPGTTPPPARSVVPR